MRAGVFGSIVLHSVCVCAGKQSEIGEVAKNGPSASLQILMYAHKVKMTDERSLPQRDVKI